MVLCLHSYVKYGCIILHVFQQCIKFLFSTSFQTLAISYLFDSNHSGIYLKSYCIFNIITQEDSSSKEKQKLMPSKGLELLEYIFKQFLLRH